MRTAATAAHANTENGMPAATDGGDPADGCGAAAEALQATSRARLAAIVAASADAIIGETLDGLITDWNPAAERLFGYSAAEAIGRPIAMLAPHGDPAEIDGLLARARAGETIAALETVRQTRDGRLIDVSVSVAPVRDDAGRIVAASAIVRDISAWKAAERERAATHQHTRQVLERITDGFFAVDPEWRFIYVNDAAERMLGQPRADLIGRSVWAAFPQAMETPLYAAYHRAMRDGETVTIELFYPPFGRWFEVRGHPSADGLSVFFRDITESRELVEALRASEARYHALIDGVPAVIYVLAGDEVQTPLYISPRLRALTGFSVDEMLARRAHWLDWVHPDDRERVAATDAASTAAGRAFRAEFRHLCKDGGSIWVRDECEPVLDDAGQIAAWYCVLQDITERKQLEYELRAALEAAQAAARTKSLFLSVMSHELRTPLQAVLGYADFLLLGSEGELTPAQREDVGYIHAGAARMTALINQVLDLSRMEAGGIELAAEPVDLRDVVEQVRQDVAPQAAAKGLAIGIELPASLPPLVGDADRLRQALLNLAGNAVKFTERGEVRIIVGVAEGGGEVTAAVRDTGVGIGPEALPHIFEEFRQVDGGMTRRHGGAGLGLAIARTLIEQMGGRITIETAPAVGSTFTLHIPTTSVG